MEEPCRVWSRLPSVPRACITTTYCQVGSLVTRVRSHRARIPAAVLICLPISTARGWQVRSMAGCCVAAAYLCAYKLLHVSLRCRAKVL